MAIYKNITTGTTTTLITKGGTRNGHINKITIANVDGHQADNVCLFLEDETASASTNPGNKKFYFFKDVPLIKQLLLISIDIGLFLIITFGLTILSMELSI